MAETAPTLDTIRAVARRTFPARGAVAVERVPQGVSTYVYRLHYPDARLYLRVLPEAGAGFAPEVRALRLLAARGVSVPGVVHHAHRDPTLGRAVLVTTEIPGRSLAEAGLGPDTPRVLREAGRMLSHINALPVAGFGWVARDRPRAVTIRAPHRTYRAFALASFDADVSILAARVLAPRECAALRATVARHDAWLDAGRAVLAHGDFDVTPIFQDGAGCGGIIDFGELRGADRWYDLGHFHYRDGETLPGPLLPWLLAGYGAVAPLPANAARRISFAALLIGTRALARLLARRAGVPGADHYVAAGVAALRRDIVALQEEASGDR